MATERDSLIRERAYELWEKRGRPSGSAEEDWLQAERSVAGRGESATLPQTGTSDANGEGGPAKLARARKPAAAKSASSDRPPAKAARR